MNIPLFILGWKKIGKALLFSSLYATAVSSVMIDALAAVHTFQPMDPILACLYGGAICGVAFGVMLRQSATTGGTELAARLLKLKFESISIGTLCLVIDVLVTFGYALIFRDMTRALYGVIALYVSSLLMDKVVYGPNAAKMAYIISERSEEITQKLLELDRGVTLLDGTARGAAGARTSFSAPSAAATSFRSKSSCRRSTRTPSSSSATRTRSSAKASAPTRRADCKIGGIGMKKLCCALLAAATLALCGCGSFLERTYSSSQPHSATYYESEDRSVLRAEGYQDLVNDILLLVGENAKEGTIWLYNTSDSDTQDAGEAARRACQEVQTQTPMGAYMVDYLTCKTSTGSRNYTQIDLTIGYRRTAEQAAAIVHATERVGAARPADRGRRAG